MLSLESLSRLKSNESSNKNPVLKSLIDFRNMDFDWILGTCFQDDTMVSTGWK